MNKKIIGVCVVFGLAVTLFMWFGNIDFTYDLVVEDGVVETLSALFYLIALILCILTVVKDKRFTLAYIWLFLSLFFLGEETSWFQRILGYSVESVEELNAQNEFNLHNLEIFQGGGLSQGSFNWKAFLKSQNLFRLGFFGYFLILPLLSYWSWLKKILNKIRYERPINYFALGILVVYITSFSFTLLAEDRVERRPLGESREMLYAFFIMVYTFYYIWMKRNTSKLQA